MTKEIIPIEETSIPVNTLIVTGALILEIRTTHVNLVVAEEI